MKRRILSLVLVGLSVLTLAACQKSGSSAGSTSSTTSSQTTKTAQLTITFSKDKTETFKNLPVSASETVMSLLESKEKVVEKSGFITKIGDTEQDASKNLYWMYKVNGKLADKGASQEKVADGDKIEFYLES